MKYWIMKSEPIVFGIDALAKKPHQTEPWDGVRNYQARNFIREMRNGDYAFFYHSNCKVPGIVGTMKIVSDPYPDNAAFNPESRYFDPKSTPENPRWHQVDVQFQEKFEHPISLQALKNNPFLENILIIRKGNRLSITPIKKDEWQNILSMKNALSKKAYHG